MPASRVRGPATRCRCAHRYRQALDHWSVRRRFRRASPKTIKGYVVGRELADAHGRAEGRVRLAGESVGRRLLGVDLRGRRSDPTGSRRRPRTYIDEPWRLQRRPAKPHFLAIDRYEADDFTQRAYVNGYCYGPREWERYFDFCKAVEPRAETAGDAMANSREPHAEHERSGQRRFRQSALGHRRQLHAWAIRRSARTTTTCIRRFSRCSSRPSVSGRHGCDGRRRCSSARNRSTSAIRLTPTFRCGAFSRCCSAAVQRPASFRRSAILKPWARNKLNAYMDKPIEFGAPSRRCK